MFLFNAEAAEVCVSTAAELQSALATAGNNAENDVIKVMQGTYTMTASIIFSYTSGEAFSISVLGGYAANCTQRQLNPTNTILDGNNTFRVINLNGIATGGSQHLQGFTIRNGFFSINGQRGAGANIGGSAGFKGDVTVDFNIFEFNVNPTSFSGGLSVSADGGNCNITNNLLYNNSALNYGAGSILCNGTNSHLVNNTIVSNTITLDNGNTHNQGGLSATGAADLYAYNNILWGNTKTDFNYGSTTNTLVNNDIEDQTGTLGIDSSGNLSVNPEFVSASNFRLEASSPLINQGKNTPPGGLPATDLDGKTRIAGETVDMGAYEYYPDDGCYAIKSSNSAVVVFCL